MFVINSFVIQESRAEIRILMLGDSITAGYGLENKESLPVRLESALQAQIPGQEIRIINGGVSGDTTAGGKARLDWLLFDEPHAVIIALGGNDTLRGLKPSASKDNLQHILRTLQSNNIPALLTGMQAPRNLGDDFAERFNTLYPALAKEFDVLFYPFLLEGVATDPAFNQPDGIHPNPQGVQRIITGMLPLVTALIKRLQNNAS